MYFQISYLTNASLGRNITEWTTALSQFILFLVCIANLKTTSSILNEILTTLLQHSPFIVLQLRSTDMTCILGESKCDQITQESM